MDLEEFVDALQKELAHRKREMVKVELVISDQDRGSDHSGWLSRTAVLLAYAHWEGFVKEASKKYVKYVNSCQVRVADLTISLQAVSMVGCFKRARESEKAYFLGTVLADIDAFREKTCRLDPDKVVDTESNLSARAFENLVVGLGLDYLDEYRTLGAFIDRKLLDGRNAVAHGSLMQFTVEEGVERLRKVLMLLDNYSDHLINAAQNRKYLASTTV